MKAEIGESWVNDEPDNDCFACSPHNPTGLQMRFTRTGEHQVEVRYSAPHRFSGMPGIIHGGLQATLLDDTMSGAAHCAPEIAEGTAIVTVEFHLRYHAPAKTECELTIRGEFERLDGRDVYLKGAILDPADKLLTSATARWRILEPRPA